VYWCGAQGEGTAVTTLQLAGTAATAGDADADAMTVGDDVSETRQTHVVLGSALGTCLGGGGVQGGGLILLNKVNLCMPTCTKFLLLWYTHLGSLTCTKTRQHTCLCAH
jgi:hypothetical protein